MKLPLTIGGRDVVVTVASGAVPIANIVAAASPGTCDGGQVPVLGIGGRRVSGGMALDDAGVRPGDAICDASEDGSLDDTFDGMFDGMIDGIDDSGVVVDVVAGIDAGRSIPIRPASGPDDSVHVSVGRSPEMDVRLASPAVSQHHCTLTLVGEHVVVRDAGSRNGTVARRKRLGPEPIEVAFGQPIRCGPSVIVVRRATPVDTPRQLRAAMSSAASGPVPFYRSPIDRVGEPAPPVAAPPPPRSPRGGRPALLAVLLPLTMMAVMAKFAGVDRSMLPMYAMFALMGPAMLLLSSADRARSNRRVRRRSRRRFRREVSEFADDVERVVADEVGRRAAMHPDVCELARLAHGAGAALWSRREDHPQYLDLALGMADVPWEKPIEDAGELDQRGLDQRGLERLSAIVEQAATLPLAPVAVPARPGTVIGLAGDRSSCLATVRGLIVQIAALHGPAEVRMVLVTSAGRAAAWEWTKWLPHLCAAFDGERLLAVVGDGDGNIDGAAIDEVLNDVDANTTVVAVIDAVGLSDGGDLAVKRLLRRGDGGATGIVLAATTDALPGVCSVVVDHHQTAGEATVRWPLQAGRSLEIVAAGITPAVAGQVARRLARLSDPDAGGGSAALPRRVSLAALLDLDGEPSAATERVVTRWRSAEGGLRTVVGAGHLGATSVDLAHDGPHLMVMGGRGSGKTEHLSAATLAMAAHYPPERLHLVVWGESFGHLHRLPHLASSLSRIDEAAFTTFCDGIERELTRRERLRAEGGVDGLPRLAIVIDDVDTISRIVPSAPEALVRILRRSRGLGTHVLWSAGRHHGGSVSELVELSLVRVVQRVATASESNDLLGTDAAAHLERSLPGRAYVLAGRAEPREVQGGAVSIAIPRHDTEIVVTPFQLAGGRLAVPEPLGEPCDRALLAAICAAGATSTRPIDLLSPATAAVAMLDSPGLLELLGLDNRGGLAVATDQWHTIDGDSFLRVPIGVDAERRPVALDLKESALGGMGPHGLLVGATGSGKSELLRTLVCGLALTHSPEALALVLVDFKGGASFASLGRLPHVAGVVTNLADDLALVDRILAALHGEQRRRQELLAAAGNLANAREYRAMRQAGRLPEELANEPLPELLIIVDEFAELLDQEPAFIEFFLTIGRVGRSLGIHLLLASQRLEEGKLRGLDTYLSYRLGLRTFSAAESRIVLGVPDAYSLPPAPGGGYLKVGSTSFERFQASYVSGPLDGDRDGDPSVEVDGDGDAQPATVVEAIIAKLAHVAPGVHQIWLPPLGTELALDPLFGEGGFVHDPRRGFASAAWPASGDLAIPLGLLDEPGRQRQLPLAVDFAGAHGNLALAGAPQSGKSLLVRTAVLSLATTHTPEEVQVYAVDFGGGTLESLAELPHVGGVASRLDGEMVRRLVSHVEGLLEARERLFREHAIDSVATFRQRRSEGALPADVGGDVFLVIDGWAAFRERFEHVEPTIADLAARGLGYGIHVVITVTRWMEVRPSVLDAIGGRLELRLNSAIDSAFDRRRAELIRADQPGRGLHPSGLMFHTALPRLDGVASNERLTDATALAVDHIASRWDGWRPAAVAVLPDHIEVADLPATDATGVPVGVLEQDLSTWAFDLAGDPHFFVYGDGESGKTTVLRTWLSGLTRRAPAEAAQVVLIDYRRTLLETVPPSHLGGYAASEPAAEQLIAEVVRQVSERLPGPDVTPAQLRARSWWHGPDWYVVVDDYDLVATASSNPLGPLLPLLAQGRDLGLHVVVARRVSGAAKGFYEPVTSRLREVSPNGLILSGDRDEGVLIGGVRAGDRAPGRGTLVLRRRAPQLVQVAWSPPPDETLAADSDTAADAPAETLGDAAANASGDDRLVGATAS